MKNKILSAVFSLALVFGVFGVIGTQVANAQYATSFAAGCTSNLGYSVTNGTPCNGTATATTGVAGCTTALGYSVTNGAPCDGATLAIQYLAGCSSIYSYSTISGAPCNGTTVASVAPTTPVTVTTPGLPTTGAGGNAPTNTMLLLASGLVAILGSTYLVRKYRATN